MFELNATLIAQIINFLILLLILAKVAWKPLISAIEERQAQIARNIDNAERDKAAAEQFRQEMAEQLAQARTQAQAIVDKAVKMAEQAREEILTEARNEHARMLKAAQEQIIREREQALAEIRKEVVGLSLAAAGKIIQQNMDAETNARLVDDFISKLGEQKPGGLPC